MPVVLQDAKPSVAILGNGPAGAFINRACLEQGITPDVFSATPICHIPAGAFWYHDLPEALKPRVPAATILNVGLGKGSTYSAKMWGLPLKSSFPTVPSTELGYNAKASLRELWAPNFKVHIKRFDTDGQVLDFAQEYDLVFQTFPTYASRKHNSFVSRRIFTYTKPVPCLSKLGICLYNGLTNPKLSNWLRLTWLFGTLSIETLGIIPTGQSGFKLAGVETKLHPETKPVEGFRDDNIILVGRFAQWSPKMLAHEAYSRAKLVLTEMRLGLR